MSTVVTRRKDCRLCGSKDLALALALAPAPLVDAYIPESRLSNKQDRYPLDLFLCRACGHAQLLDVIDPEVLYRDYLYETTTSLGLPEHFRSYAADVMRRVNPKPGMLAVDVGSNDGTLLKAFREAGLKVLGVDPAREIAAKATAEGVETLPVFFSASEARRILAAKGPATVVTTNNVFANLDDLTDIVNGIRTLLAPDGVYVLEFMYLADLVQNFVFDYIYHEHLSYFSVKPLRAFFARHGLEVIDAQRVPTKGGSLRLAMQPAGGPRPVDGSVARLIASEESSGLHELATYKAFAAKIASAKDEVARLIQSLKARGQSVAAYGASATTTTFLYHFGLTDAIDFLVDDAKSRQRLYSPGAHIPVLCSQALYEKKPETTLIAAWRYAQPIMAKHAAYLDAGGQFLVPLPEIRTVRKAPVA